MFEKKEAGSSDPAFFRASLIARLRGGEFEAQHASLQGLLDEARANRMAFRTGERQEEQRRGAAQVRAAETRLVNTRVDFERFSPGWWRPTVDEYTRDRVTSLSMPPTTFQRMDDSVQVTGLTAAGATEP